MFSFRYFMIRFPIFRKFFKKFNAKVQSNAHLKKYIKYSFDERSCDTFEQYEAVITKLYHSIEKGLSYSNFRPGFGKNVLFNLLDMLDAYNKREYKNDTFCYETALSVIEEYIKKNKEYGFDAKDVEERLQNLPGKPNNAGGTNIVYKMAPYYINDSVINNFFMSRHSIREFSDVPVDIELVKKAISFAQITPSACNRQGWKTRIIEDRALLKKVLDNQNGNKGFGNGIDKLILVTADLNYFNNEREINQCFIDGGLFAMNMLWGLHYYGIATIPLSASLNMQQEKNVRDILHINEFEELIIFIGIGNYPNECLTTKSSRRDPNISTM